MSNQVNKNEVKEITYFKMLQRFNEVSNLGDEKSDAFYTTEKKEKVIHNANRTIVILDDGSKGIAKCCEGDKYDKLIGIKIAYLRAKIKSLNKELKSLTK